MKEKGDRLTFKTSACERQCPENAAAVVRAGAGGEGRGSRGHTEDGRAMSYLCTTMVVTCVQTRRVHHTEGP